MSEFTLSIKLGNDAMQTEEDVAEALVEVAQRIERGGDEPDLLLAARSGGVRDRNGNTVGRWTLTLPDVDDDEEEGS